MAVASLGNVDDALPPWNQIFTDGTYVYFSGTLFTQVDG